ncbi:hypothetical protein ACFV1W_38825 [Kitasatospora sp. NPDC059648]
MAKARRVPHRAASVRAFAAPVGAKEAVALHRPGAPVIPAHSSRNAAPVR